MRLRVIGREKGGQRETGSMHKSQWKASPLSETHRHDQPLSIEAELIRG